MIAADSTMTLGKERSQNQYCYGSAEAKLLAGPEDGKRVKIAVVIVNYRTSGMVIDCLESLSSEAGPTLDIEAYVGDAASGDGSLCDIQEAITKRGWSDWAQVEDLGRNGGFAFGNNEILKRWVLPNSDASFIHFLNPDTYVRPGALLALVETLEKVPNVGVVGSQLENPDGSLRPCAFRFPTLWREFFRGLRLGPLNRLVPQVEISISPPVPMRKVDWVSGASFMVPRKTLNTIGLMDDDFFLYFEETEFMARIHDAGLSVWHVPQSRVVHFAGQATGQRVETGRPLLPSSHWLASRRRYFHLRYGRLGALLADIAFLSGDVLYRLHRLLLLKRSENPPNLWASYLSRRRAEQ